uniref:Uncharacterized protein n=1 Tax=Vespula pensylvanica TaxID=30213 RepID=A0A834NII5_VESPE|nr:hypothetical protein H0235_013936 [Vespula pensylvanica]
MAIGLQHRFEKWIPRFLSLIFGLNRDYYLGLSHNPRCRRPRRFVLRVDAERRRRHPETSNPPNLRHDKRINE